MAGMTAFYERSAMKIRLGRKTIDPEEVNHFEQIGSEVCLLEFVTGESITVKCGVKIPDNTISFGGTPEDLKALLAEYIEANKSADRKPTKRERMLTAMRNRAIWFPIFSLNDDEN